MKCPVVTCGVSMGLVWLWENCILMLRAVFLHCWRISMVCLTLELVSSWVEHGFSVGMEAFGWGVFWSSQVLDLSLLPLAFSLILTVASRVLHPYSTDDKTSRSREKRFSTVRDIQRRSWRYMEKTRGSREIEVTRRRRGRVSKGETNLATNQFPKCSPQPRRPREIYRVNQRREGGGRR